jgi:hypothetical protein
VVGAKCSTNLDRPMIGALALALAALPVKLAAPGFTCSGVPDAVCSAYLDRFSSLLRSERLKVTTANDVANVLGIERQKQLLGCGDQTACLAELAGALGVDGIVSGSVVKTETAWLATLKVVRASDGSTWLDASERLRSEDELANFLDSTARDFSHRLAPAPSRNFTRWIPGAVGAAALVVGTSLFVVAKKDAGRLGDAATPIGYDEARFLAGQGRVFEPLGLTLLSVGLTAMVATVLWVLLW